MNWIAFIYIYATRTHICYPFKKKKNYNIQITKKIIRRKGKEIILVKIKIFLFHFIFFLTKKSLSLTYPFLFWLQFFFYSFNFNLWVEFL